ncbi:malonyl-ACP O-methyltransferase BioC [Gayadomonas joobiniege]|uniref:malonyl-ACP O-methyltransferase BioC n=1 Tax=Gayadomonas joobiniege TaxID=1234606 RepID=UPI000371F02E|nr:malonyl-ACP O-methyltransferase BioC [Gayadomonas joobiniege]
MICSEPVGKHAVFVHQHFSRAASSYDQAARLQKQVIINALNYLPKSPAQHAAYSCLDIGCGTGNLLNHASFSNYTGVDLAAGMLQRARCKFPLKNTQFIRADAHHLPFKHDSFDLIFSSLVVQWCQLTKVLTEAYRVLKPGGRFLFTSLTKGTLAELQNAFLAIDQQTHVNQFMSQPALQQCLQNSKFNIKQLDFVQQQTDYQNVMALLQELKSIGANTVINGQPRNLSRTTLKRLEDNYPKTHGQVLASWQLVYCLLEK